MMIWIRRHLTLSFFVLCILAIIFEKENSWILFLPGIPPVIGTYRGLTSLYNRWPSSYSLGTLVRALSLSLLLFILSLGPIAFLLGSVGTLIEGLSRPHAGGEIGMSLMLLVAWASYIIAWFANGIFIKLGLWPSPLKPDFNFLPLINTQSKT